MFTHKGICTYLCAIALIALMATAASAQVFRGSISGTVTDQSDAVVPNATAVATAVATGILTLRRPPRPANSSFQFCPWVSTNVVVSTSGFASVKVEKVPVSAGTTYTLHVKIVPAQVLTTVDVNAAPLVLKTEESTLETTLPIRPCKTLPVTAGTHFTRRHHGGECRYNAPGGGSAASINVIVQIRSTFKSKARTTMIRGGISRCQCQWRHRHRQFAHPGGCDYQSSFVTSSTAEAGRNAGGTLNLVIKSGTNDLHGSAYDYIETKPSPRTLPLPLPEPGRLRTAMKTVVSRSVDPS